MPNLPWDVVKSPLKVRVEMLAERDLNQTFQEWKMECEIDKWIASAEIWKLYWAVVVKRELSLMMTLSLQVDLHFNYYLWSLLWVMNKQSRRPDCQRVTTGQRQGEELRVELLLHCVRKEPVEMIWASDRTSPCEGIPGTPCGRHPEGIISHLDYLT